MDSLAKRVRKLMQREIITCILPPGEHVSELQLSRRYRVSRTPIRQACLELERMGLLRALPHRGYLVKPIDLHDIQEIYQFRSILESASAKLAARARGEPLVQEIEKLLKSWRGKRADEVYEKYMATDQQFHILVARVSGNGHLVSTLTDVLKQVQRVYYFALRARVGPTTHDEHIEIFEAIKKGDADLAEALMIEHIAKAKERVLRPFLKLT